MITLPTSTWTFFTLNVDVNGDFWTTYPPHLVHVVIERPQSTSRWSKTIITNSFPWWSSKKSKYYYYRTFMKAFVGGKKKSLLHPISTVTNWTKNPLPLVHQALLQQKHYYIMDCNRILSCSKGKYILDGQLHDNFCVFVWIIICWVCRKTLKLLS